MNHTMLPDDAHNRTLTAHVHPPQWVSPTPADRYNLVIVGGGPAGLVAAFGAAGLGARVALVERAWLGGDCLVSGCVPSKALLESAHAARSARRAGPVGVSAEVQTDFAAIMQRMRAIRAGIAPHDSAARLAAEGIDVFFGEARFSGKDRLRVGETELVFARCCIATGARAAIPPIPGLDTVDALTNETLFQLTEQPESLAILGAGVIGCEMAQAFAAFGTEVHLFDQADRVLSREDAEASALVQQALVEDGVHLHLGASITRVDPSEGGATVTLADGTGVTAKRVLVALGRRPNLDLDLERAGVATHDRGIVVDDHLRTTNARIYAAGDVNGIAQFTHAADHQARIVIRNALFFGRSRHQDLVVPRVTYTQPELAAVGISTADAQADPSLTTYTVPLAETDRGRTADATGFVRVHADAKGRIHGATIVGDTAGELLAPVTQAITHGLTLGQVVGTIHPYPTLSEAFFKVASEHNRTRLKPWIKSLFTWILRWRR